MKALSRQRWGVKKLGTQEGEGAQCTEGVPSGGPAGVENLGVPGGKMVPGWAVLMGQRGGKGTTWTVVPCSRIENIGRGRGPGVSTRA